MTDYYNFCIGTEFRSFLSEELSSLLPDSFAGFSTSPSVLAFEFGAGEDDRPSFSSLTTATVARG